MVTLGATNLAFLHEVLVPPPSRPPKASDLSPIGLKVKIVIGTSAWAHFKGLVE